MIGLNPGILEKDKFAIMWLEASNCDLKEVLADELHVKGTSAKRISVLKIFKNPMGDIGYVCGKWDMEIDGSYVQLIQFLRFIDDSYLVAYYGNKFSFSVINILLESFMLPRLSDRYLLDIEDDILSGVEDKDGVKGELERLDDISENIGDIGQKTEAFKDGFIEKALPIIKNGLK